MSIASKEYGLKILDELEKLDKQATPKPWFARKEQNPAFEVWVDSEEHTVCSTISPVKDNKLIAQSRNALSALIKVARAADEFTKPENQILQVTALTLFEDLKEALKELKTVGKNNE